MRAAIKDSPPKVVKTYRGVGELVGSTHAVCSLGLPQVDLVCAL